MAESSLSRSYIELCTGKWSPPFLDSTMERLYIVRRDHDVAGFLEGWISCAHCSSGNMGMRCGVPAHTSALPDIRLWLGMTIYAACFLSALFL